MFTPSFPAVASVFIQVKVVERRVCLQGGWAAGECSYEDPTAAWAYGEVGCHWDQPWEEQDQSQK